MATMTTMKVLYVMVVCTVAWVPYTLGTGLSCGQVIVKLTPCLNYLTSGGAVSPACCNGIKELKAAAKTTQERQIACGCMKAAYKSFSGINPNNALVLPNKCGVKIPYKISLKTDCSKVK